MTERFSKLGLLFVSLGAAVGLGNLWRFPYISFRYGIEFVIVYIALALGFVVPIILGEYSLGRKNKGNILTPIKTVFKYALPVLFLLVGTQIFILSYYVPITAITLDYASTPLQYTPSISDFMGSNLHITLFVIIVLLVLYIISKGLKKGFELIMDILMPVFFIILLLIFMYVVFFIHNFSSLEFHPSNFFNIHMWADAFSQALFSLSAGVGVMIVYGSHARKDENLFKLSYLVFLFDTCVSIIAYFILAGFLSTTNTPMNSSLLVSFNTFEELSRLLPFGNLLVLLFFTLLFLAAFTSVLSTFETITLMLSDFKSLKKRYIYYYIGALVLVLGFIAIKWNLISFFDNIASTYLLTFSSMLISYIVGDKKTLKTTVKNEHLLNLYHIILRYINPILILLFFFIF